MLSPSEIKKRAIEFSREHAGDADQKSQAQNFWRDFFSVWGLSPQRIGVFESRARTLKGIVGFIDFFWPGTLLVEHKSRGKDLDAAVDKCCRKEPFKSELERVEFLFGLYEKYTVSLTAGAEGKKPQKGRKK